MIKTFLGRTQQEAVVTDERGSGFDQCGNRENMLIADASRCKYSLDIGRNKLADLLFDITLVQSAQNFSKRIHEPLLPSGHQ